MTQATPSSRQLPQISEETFKRWLAVLIAIVTLLVAIASFLQIQASTRAAFYTRISQQAAIRATGNQSRGQQEFAYGAFTVLPLSDELYSLAIKNGALTNDPLGQAYLNARDSLKPLSPLLAQDYVQQNDKGQRTATDLGKYEADKFVVAARLDDERRTAYAQAGNGWSGKSDNFVGVIAMLAVSLSLFALSVTLHSRMRWVFVSTGIVIATIAFWWMLFTALNDVHEIPDAAMAKVAEGAGYAVQATDYSTDNTTDFYQHANENWQKAVDAYGEALQLDAKYANAYSLRGLARLELNPPQAKEAIADLQEAVARGKGDYSAYWNLGAAYFRNGEFEKVAEPSRKALELNTRICGPAFNIALASLAQSQWDDAGAQYEAAITRCDGIYQDAVNNKEDPPPSLWASMQDAVNQLDNMLCAAVQQHCYPQRPLPTLAANTDTKALSDHAEALRKRLKEALTALEFQGTTKVTATGARFDPVQFGYYIVDDKNEFISYAVRDVFPYSTTLPDIDALTTYHNMSPDVEVVWKVFRDGNEEIGMRYADKWNLGTEGPVVKKVNSWYAPAPGHYEFEAYANGELLGTGSFEISTESTLADPLPTGLKPTAPVQVGKLLFADSFKDNYANWWTGTAASKEVGAMNGELELVTHQDNHSFSSGCTLCGPFTDFYYEADTRYVSGPTNFGYGLAFRGLNNLKQLYTFMIDGEGYYTVSKFDDHWSDVIPWTPNSFINRKGANNLGVACRGSACDFYINGHKVDSKTDSTLAGSFIGVTVSNTDVDAAFDNVRVWELQ